MEEEWRPVKGYEGLYEVSNMGNVRSLKRYTTSGKVLKPIVDKDGYYKVSLSKNNVRIGYFIHRLVAEAFVEGQSEINHIVNHKNEIKNDNRAENLEWCTIKYNTNYNSASYRRMTHRRKPLVAIKGDEVLHFSHCEEAAEVLGLSPGNVRGCLLNYYGRKTLKGYRFEYI